MVGFLMMAEAKVHWSLHLGWDIDKTLDGVLVKLQAISMANVSHQWLHPPQGKSLKAGRL